MELHSIDSLIGNVGIGLAAIGIINTSVWLWNRVSSFIYQKLAQFTLNGVWFADFYSEMTGVDSEVLIKHNYEIFKIKQYKEKLSIKCEHYTNKRKEILKTRGNGIFRTSEIYSIYYIIDKYKGGAGEHALRLKFDVNRNPLLDGYAIEWDKNYEHSSKLGAIKYRLELVKLPFLCQLRSFVGLPSYTSYDSLKDALEANKLKFTSGHRLQNEDFKGVDHITV